MNEYLKRKNSEINLISSELKLNKQINCTNEFDALKKKENITIKLRNYNNKKYYHELTNNKQLGFNEENFSYKYTYERFNGFININNFANDFYCIKKQIKTRTYFTNCGMSAIASLLTSVISSSNIKIELLYEETYFETIKYINMLMKDKSEFTGSALYIDTIASDFEFELEKLITNHLLVIIDTTCFLGYKFQRMINKILKLHIPCILVRSHTKLDMNGTEYSHMGSVSFLNVGEELTEIEFNCRHLIGVFGACLPPERFPKFILNNELIKLNKKRIDCVSFNTERFCSNLIKKGIKVSMPNHKQFCLIYFQNDKYTLEELKKMIIDFCNDNSKKYPVYHAVSFGFDYIAIDCYQNFIDGTYKIRVCLNDLSYKKLTSFEEVFVRFLEKIIN